MDSSNPRDQEDLKHDVEQAVAGTDLQILKKKL